MRVLLVDDDRVGREALAELLRYDGHAVAEAAAPLDVILLLDGPPPDAVVLDHRLPGSDGLALLARLRESPGWDVVPVVLLTADPEVEAPEGPPGPHGGPFASLRKPAQAAEVLAAVERAKGGA